MRELFADVNGIKICYEIQGEGEPVFLIHGFGAKKETWIAQFGPLSEHFKVIRFDNRGAGKSDRPDVPYTMEILADDINNLMDYLNIEKAHIVGHSLGGMIVLNFLLKYPERVNKAVLISTLPDLPFDKVGLEMYKKSNISFYEERLINPEKAFFNKMKQRFTRQFFKLMQQDPKRKFHCLWSVEDLMQNENIDAWTPQDITNHVNAIAGHNTSDRLQEIKKETLILCGDKDRLTPKISSEKIHERIPNSILKVIEGGHFFPLEKAPEVNQTLLEFLHA